MNDKDQVLEKSNFYTKMINKILSSMLFVIAISLFLILLSFHPEDTGWGVINETTPVSYTHLRAHET